MGGGPRVKRDGKRFGAAPRGTDHLLLHAHIYSENHGLHRHPRRRRYRLLLVRISSIHFIIIIMKSFSQRKSFLKNTTYRLIYLFTSHISDGVTIYRILLFF